MMMSGRCAPHFLFETSKRKCAAPGGKENMFGGSACAGGGRLAVPCGSQRRKRAALGETSSPGRYRDTPLPLSPLPLTLPRRTRQRLAKRKARKEKLVECILAPRRCRHHPPRDSSHDLAEDDSVPEGKPKSALAPIRRPPSAQRRECAGVRQKRPFLLDRARPVFFSARPKRKWGAHCPAILMAESTRAADCRPCGASRRKPPLWGRGSKKRRPALRPAAPRSVFMPKIP